MSISESDVRTQWPDLDDRALESRMNMRRNEARGKGQIAGCTLEEAQERVEDVFARADAALRKGLEEWRYAVCNAKTTPPLPVNVAALYALVHDGDLQALMREVVAATRPGKPPGQQPFATRADKAAHRDQLLATANEYEVELQARKVKRAELEAEDAARTEEERVKVWRAEREAANR